MSPVAAPFRGLDPFTDSAEDAALFFGREDEIRITSANLLTSRLTVLYGPSGVGKSSLVRAGLAHRLRSDGDEDEPSRRAVVVMDDWGTDPAAELLRRARAAAGDGEGPQDGSLEEALRDLTRSRQVELLIVLDQFEEYLTRARVGELDAAIAPLAEARGVPNRLLK
jgi:hypothetical protein